MHQELPLLRFEMIVQKKFWEQNILTEHFEFSLDTNFFDAIHVLWASLSEKVDDNFRHENAAKTYRRFADGLSIIRNFAWRKQKA